MENPKSKIEMPSYKPHQVLAAVLEEEVKLSTGFKAKQKRGYVRATIAEDGLVRFCERFDAKIVVRNGRLHFEPAEPAQPQPRPWWQFWK